MSDIDRAGEETPMDRALDQALARSLPPPAMPAHFRARLLATIARAPRADAHTSLAALEAEHAAQLATLKSGYVRLQRRTLGTLIGAAFATGVVVALAMPWIRANYGEDAVFAVPLIGAAVGVAIGAWSWLQRTAVGRLVR
jgi:hypothetical protein